MRARDADALTLATTELERETDPPRSALRPTLFEQLRYPFLSLVARADAAAR